MRNGALLAAFVAAAAPCAALCKGLQLPYSTHHTMQHWVILGSGVLVGKGNCQLSLELSTLLSDGI